MDAAPAGCGRGCHRVMKTLPRLACGGGGGAADACISISCLTTLLLQIHTAPMLPRQIVTRSRITTPFAPILGVASVQFIRHVKSVPRVI